MANLVQRIIGALTRNGTNGRTYGGDENLIHVPDGFRGAYGKRVADFVDQIMREGAEGRTPEEIEAQALCPGCYMVVMFNASLYLAARSGQHPAELSATLGMAYAELGRRLELIEEITLVAPQLERELIP